MSNTNSKDLRAALARAIKFHCEANGLNGVSGGKLAGIANSRMSQILRGDVEKISSDALVDIAGSLGYRLTSVIGSNDGHEFALKVVEQQFVDDPGLKVYEKAALASAPSDVDGFNPEQMTANDLADNPDSFYEDVDADRVIADA